MSTRGQKTKTSHIEWDVFISLIKKLEDDEEYKFCLLISVGCFTGILISDLLKIKYTDILDNNQFKIKNKKSNKETIITVNPTLKKIVQRIYDKTGKTNKDEFIFINKYGKKPIDRSWVNVKLKQIFYKYDVKVSGNISSHTLRKTFGIRTLELNNYSYQTLILLKKLFNHYDVSITEKYLNVCHKKVPDIFMFL